MIQQQEGKKLDTGKLRYDLVHHTAHKGMVEILSFGAEKYGDWNWTKGLKWSRVLAALKRHLAAIERGEDIDPESGRLHADHVQCNAHFLSAYYKIYPEGDDRPHKYLKKRKIGLDIDGVLANFSKHLLEISGNKNHQCTHWQDPIIDREFAKVKNDASFWASLPILTDRKDIPFEPHCYITARSIDPKITQKWLDDNHFPKAPLYCVGSGESKVDAARKSGIDIFVDDNYDNFCQLTHANIFTYLFDAPYNQHYDVGHKRIFSLKQLN